MAPLLISYGQSLVDQINKEILVEEYLKERGITTTTATDAPDILAQDDAEVNLETEINNSSADVTLDQSNNGFSLVNFHSVSYTHLTLPTTPYV